MPVIAKKCDINNIIHDRIEFNSTKTTILGFLLEVKSRVMNGNSNNTRELDVFGKINTSNAQVFQAKIFKLINTLSRELNDRLEFEKKQGKEPSNSDLEMINILQNILPDLIINYCKRMINMNNMKSLGGSRKKSNKKEKTRKHRKV